MIDIRDVSKSYGDLVVVDDVSIQLPGSGITSIIGPNGAGKSTLLSMISRLLPMTAGVVRVDELDVATTAGAVLARRMAILRQDNHLSARIRVQELVEFGRYPHSQGRPTVEDRDHVERALAYLELEDLRDRFLDELSGGQRQRAFVAMVLCQDTRYVLLDEPLNSLDMRHSVSMMQQLRAAADALQKSIVMVIHDINFAASYSDTMIAMREGKVVVQGRPDEIIRADVLYQIYDLELEVHQIGGRPVVVYYR